MKRILTSAGLVALGAASAQAAYTPGLTPMETAKPWSVSVGVRGFYDDNIFTAPDDSGRKEESGGVSINPTVGLNFALDQTLISFNYSYDFRWFEARDSDEADHIHMAKLRVSHAFSERFNLDVSERFIVAQEGAVVIDAGPVTVPGRSDGDYFRNIADLDFKAGLTEKVSLGIGFQNQIIDYEQDGPNSYSALLDRIEYLPSLEVLIALTPNTTGIIGGRYNNVSSRSTDTYTAVISSTVTAFGVPADTRDRVAYYGYAGIEHQFNPEVSAGLRAGVEFAEYPNVDVLNAGGGNYEDSTTSPFIDGFVQWDYNPGSSLTVGLVNRMNSTDVGSAVSQSSTAATAGLNHRITPKWHMGVNALFQYSRFEGGVVDGERELIYIVGVSAGYDINQHLAAELGYNFDKLDSDLQYRSYDRNRFFVGLRARF